MHALLALTLLLAQAPATGQFAGSWSSANSSQSGDITIGLREEGGKWIGEAMFTLDGQQVPCKVTRIELTGNQLILAYQFELGGYTLISTLSGETSDGNWSGKYETKSVEGSQPVDAGTWKAKKK